MAAGKWKARMHTHARVGAKLKELRAKYDLTQTYLAKAIGCSSSAICTLEQGKTGSMELLEGVLWALGMELSDLKLGDHADLISIQRGRRQTPTLGMRKPALQTRPHLRRVA